MGSFRFYRRARIFPGLSVNLSKSGPSLTLGVRGAHMTFGPRGVRRTVGIPGTGIYYTSYSGSHSGYHSAHTEGPVNEHEQRAAEHTALVLVAIFGMVVALAVGIVVGALAVHSR
jgi:hypothetical protein